MAKKPTAPVTAPTAPSFAFHLAEQALAAKHSGAALQKLLGVSDRTLEGWLSGKVIPHLLTQEAALLRLAGLIPASKVHPETEVVPPNLTVRSGLDMDHLPHARHRAPQPHPQMTTSMSTSRRNFGREVAEINAKARQARP